MNKRILVLLSASSLVLAPAGLVLAQAQPQTAQPQTVQPQSSEPRGAASVTDFGSRHGRGFGGDLPFGRLALGTTVALTFYDGDPAAGGESVQTLNFTYGEDSEAAFAADYAEASADAAFVVVTTSPQTYTVPLSAAFPGGFGGRERGDRGGFGRGGFGPGGSR